jgi:Domain of unknown function (DUF4868)
MQETFDALRAFQFAQGNLHLWVFKRSKAPRKFSAHFVPTDDVLNGLLREVVTTEMARITEFSLYSYLAETNENSCLAIADGENDFAKLREQVDRPEPECRARSIKDLVGADGYVVKFTRDARTVYAVKRSASTWKTTYPKKYINMIFHNGELSAAVDASFSIERTFDFYYLNGRTFIAGKRAFESVMAHRVAYTQAFADLQQDAIFSGLFTAIQPLVDYVGTNSIQLRRMAVVEQKALYAKPNFLTSLQAVSNARGWGLNFDPNSNRLIPCENTARTILQVLLDHRLLSEVTQNIYDVPDAVRV